MSTIVSNALSYHGNQNLSVVYVICQQSLQMLCVTMTTNTLVQFMLYANNHFACFVLSGQPTLKCSLCYMPTITSHALFTMATNNQMYFMLYGNHIQNNFRYYENKNDRVCYHDNKNTKNELSNNKMVDAEVDSMLVLCSIG